MKIMLRRTDNGKLSEHAFIDEGHALDWLKVDTANEQRFTVCLVEQRQHGPSFSQGYFEQDHNEVIEEMTVSQFIKEALVSHDKKKAGTRNNPAAQAGPAAARTE